MAFRNLKFSDMSLEVFINKLRKKQFQLRCEKAMRTIQSFNRHEFLKEISIDYLNLLLNEKNHFFHFIDIISENDCYKYSKNQLTSYKNIDIDESIHLKSLNFFITKLMENNGAKLIQNLDNPLFINTLTFSLFPAISTYFHINFLPDNKEKNEQSSSNIVYFQLHNCNNVFYWLSEKIKQNPENKNAYQNAFDLLMRPMFFSPLFIKFCTEFFQPIFSVLQNLEINNEQLKSIMLSDFLISRFKIQFELTTHLIPSYIALNLKLSDDPIRTLVKSFFEIAFKSAEIAQYCGFFHFSRRPSNDVLDILRENLVQDQSSNNEVLRSFSNQIELIGNTIEEQLSSLHGDNNNDDDFNVLTYSCPDTIVTEEINGHPEFINDKTARIELSLKMKLFYFDESLFITQNKSLFRKVLLSQYDIEILDYIYKQDGTEKFQFSTKEEKNKNFKFINFGFSIDETDDIEENVNVTSGSRSILDTMKFDYNLITPSLRHILQDSDPIPQFKKIPPEMTEESFFDEYLVNKGPMSTLSKRKNDKKTIFDICKRKAKQNNPKNLILDALKGTTLDQSHEIELLTIATNLKKRVDKINTLLKIEEKSLQIIDNLIFLSKNDIYFKKFKRSFNSQYINNPQLLKNELLENLRTLDKCVTEKPQLILMKMIDQEGQLLNKFLSLFVQPKIYNRPIFLDFLISEKFTQTIDNFFTNVLNTHDQKVLKIFLNQSFPIEKVSESKRQKNNFLREKVENLKKCRKEIILNCKEAFIDPSVFRKIELFTKVVVDMKNWVSEDLPNFIDAIGSDELPGLVISVIFMANPPHIASNSLMVKKLFLGLDSLCFNDTAVDFMSYALWALSDLKRVIESEDDMKNVYQHMFDVIDQFSEMIEKVII